MIIISITVIVGTGSNSVIVINRHYHHSDYWAVVTMENTKAEQR